MSIDDGSGSSTGALNLPQKLQILRIFENKFGFFLQNWVELANAVQTVCNTPYDVASNVEKSKFEAISTRILASARSNSKFYLPDSGEIESPDAFRLSS